MKNTFHTQFLNKNDPFDVIIQGGQSNAEGCGGGFVTDEYLPSENVLYMNNDFTVSVAEERICDGEKINDFSLRFAAEYVRNGLLAEGRKLLILRAAVGGTGWADNRWGMTDDLYLKMMAMIKAALDLNPENRLTAFLWHQGETDFNPSSYDLHYRNLKTLVESVRDTYNYPKLPFIAGDFVNEWKTVYIAAGAPIAAAVKAVCEDIGYGAFVETDELHSNNQDRGCGDTVHFSREALNLLGLKYFKAYTQIVKRNSIRSAGDIS
ncbi:MAG: sialate O-acetylesterase [Defluviitaleaceae bacterium]|nr:sialate O-acetylesterase [Defluviitaleaceae bacterium]